jgi:head-tail adaptor
MSKFNPNRKNRGIGQLNQYVKLQRGTSQDDGMGGKKPGTAAWADIDTIMGKVDGPRNVNSFVGGAVVTDSRMTVTVRIQSWLNDIPPKMLRNHRVVWRGRAYMMIGINPVNGQPYYLNIECDGNSWEAV